MHLWYNVDYNISFDQYKLLLVYRNAARNIATRLKCKIVFEQETNVVKLINNNICVKLYPFRTGQ